MLNIWRDAEISILDACYLVTRRRRRLVPDLDLMQVNLQHIHSALLVLREGLGYIKLVSTQSNPHVSIQTPSYDPPKCHVGRSATT